MIYEYWKTRLDATGRRVYEEMLLQFKAGASRITLQDLPADQCKLIFSCLVNDHAELFSISPMVNLSSSWGQKTLSFSNLYVGREYDRRKSQLESVVTGLKNSLPVAAHDIEKEIAIADCIIDKVEYDVNVKYNQDASSVLCSGKAQCSGIAAAVKHLCDNLGLRCIKVNGEGNNKGSFVAHSWNIVYVDNIPYHLDLTFCLGANKRGCRPYRYPFFNLTDGQFAATHRWDKGSVPSCTTEFKRPACGLGASADLTPVASAYAHSESAVTCNSLFEFRQKFSEKLADAQGSFTFLSSIRCDSQNELMQIISNACRQCLTQTGKNIPLSISITENLVTIKW